MQSSLYSMHAKVWNFLLHVSTYSVMCGRNTRTQVQNSKLQKTKPSSGCCTALVCRGKPALVAENRQAASASAITRAKRKTNRNCLPSWSMCSGVPSLAVTKKPPSRATKYRASSEKVTTMLRKSQSQPFYIRLLKPISLHYQYLS